MFRKSLALIALLLAPRVVFADVTAPEILERAAPEMPESTRGLDREVVLIVSIDEEGKVKEATVESPKNDELDRIAIETAKKYRFVPAKRDGVAMPSKIKLAILLVGPPIVVEKEQPRVAVPNAPEEIEDVRVRGERHTASTTKRTLTRREIETIPGTFGDAIRAVETLPGAARAPAFSGLIVLRGSAPRDSQVFLDGMNVPIAYHFGGLTAIVPTELLERIDVYPGNYDIEYGRGMGGILDIGLRSPASDGMHGLLKIDMLDVRGLVETPIGKKSRVLVAARRSWFDAWFPAVANALSVGSTAAPVYHDAQILFEHDLTDRTRLSMTALTSSDRVSLTVAPAAADASFSGNIDNRTAFHRGQIRIESKQKQTKLSAQTSFGWDRFGIGIGKLVQGNSEAFRIDTRARMETPLAKGIALRMGADVQSGTFDYSLTFPPIPVVDEPDIGPLFGRRQLQTNTKLPYAFPAGYVGLDAKWGRVRTLLGMRVEGFTDIGGVAIEPRTNIRITLDPKTTLKGALGLYAQPPLVYEYDRVYGTPGIRFSQSVQASVGLEQQIVRGVTLSIEPFYKRLFDLVSRRVDPNSESGFRNGNEGTGFAYGTEVLLKMQPTERWMGWIAYTISRSERQALPDLPTRIFEFDQTHILSAVGSVRFDGGWELGARVRLISGNPYTPVIGAAFDADAGAYAGIEQQPIFSRRLPPFFSLDLRIEKTWRWKALTVRAYLDILNTTNRANVEAITTNFDFSSRGQIAGIPFLPNFGLRGEL